MSNHRYVRFHGTREQQLARLRESGWTVLTIKTAPVVVAYHDLAGKIHAKGWSGKADKPAFYYTFRTMKAAEAHVAEFIAGAARAEAYRANRDADRKAARCGDVAAIYEKAARTGNISATEAAVCLRAVLAREFPGVKFSVRTDHCIRVSWTDGPRSKEVEAIASQYAGEGFDGMIDMRYSISRWLSRDGSMSLAHSTGTQDSRGSNPEHIGSAHKPDAVLVSVSSDFVFCDRSISEAIKRKLCAQVCEYYGFPMPEIGDDEHEFERFLNTTRIPNAGGRDYGECLQTLIHRVTTGTLVIA